MQARINFGSAADIVSFLEAFSKSLGLDPDVKALGTVVLASQVSGFSPKAAIDAIEAHFDDVFPDHPNAWVKGAIVSVLDAIKAHL